MDAERAFVAGVVGAILLTTLASGPLVGAVDLTTAESDGPAFGDGDVRVSSPSLPANATLTGARFGSGGYYLRVPSATVHVDSVSDQARLTYQIEIPELGFSRGSIHAVTTGDEGRYSLSLQRDALDADELNADSYDGTVSIVHMSNGTERAIASKQVHVEVVE